MTAFEFPDKKALELHQRLENLLVLEKSSFRVHQRQSLS
jgi:hypothetical protein